MHKVLKPSQFRMDKYMYFGTPYIARDTLALLVEKELVPEAVITSPDAPRGRGLVLTPSETKEWACAHDIPVHAFEKLDSAALGRVASYGADYAIVVAYGKILPQSVIDLFPKGVLNVHYSLLPKYRGASPVESALLAGDTTTGVSIQKMVYKLDAGDVIASTETAISPDETTRELRPRLVTLGAELLLSVLPPYLDDLLQGVPQNESEATRCKKIDKKDGELDLDGDSLRNWNKYRAYAESPGTYFYVVKGDRNIRVKIITATFTDGVFTPDRVVPEGKKEMAYTALVH